MAYDEPALFPTRHSWKCPGCGIVLHEATVILGHKESCEKFKAYVKRIMERR